MKKRLLSIAMMVGIGFAANAQTTGATKKMSIGVELGLPTALGANNLTMVGGSLQFEFPTIAKSFHYTLSAGYISYTSYAGFIPVKAGGKYYFAGKFYGAAEIGATFKTDEGGQVAFAFAPALGTSFAVSPKSNIDLGLRFETWINDGGSSFIGLRAAYVFGL